MVRGNVREIVKVFDCCAMENAKDAKARIFLDGITANYISLILAEKMINMEFRLIKKIGIKKVCFLVELLVFGGYCIENCFDLSR